MRNAQQLDPLQELGSASPREPSARFKAASRGRSRRQLGALAFAPGTITLAARSDVLLHYEPEFTSMVVPNADQSQVGDLMSRYGGTPAALEDVVILVPADQLEQRGVS